MSEIHFVFEKPETTVRPDKKRSRLVTSCDACRTKKIKCRPTSSGDDICEACKASGTRCVYEERDRIRAERGIANFTVAPSNEASTSNQGSSRALASRASSSSSSLSSYSVGPIKPTLAIQDSNNSVLPHGCRSNNSLQPFDINADLQHVDEHPSPFDPYRPNYPHSYLLPHFVDVFLAYAGSIFPFLDPGDTMLAAVAGKMHPSIANAISAYAARFTDKVPHPSEGRHLSGDIYLKAAKSSLNFKDLGQVDRIHALILIAWTENGRGKANNFWRYGRSAALAAFELGLGSEDCIRLEPSEKTRNDLRMTFWSVVWMELVACSVAGQSPLFNLNECSTSMPFPDVHYQGSLSRVAMYGALRSVFVALRTMNEVANAGKPNSPSPYRDYSLRQIQQAVTAMRDTLNPTLVFNMENFTHAELGREGYIFYLNTDSVIDYPRLDVAWSSALTVIDIYLIIREMNRKAPVALSSFFLPISIARGALMMARSNPRNILDGLLIPATQFEELTQAYLTHSTDLLLALSRYWANMLEVKIAAQPVALYGTQMETSYWQAHRDRNSAFCLEREPIPPLHFYAQTTQPPHNFEHDYIPSAYIFSSDTWTVQSNIHKPLLIEADQSQIDQNTDPAQLAYEATPFAAQSTYYIDQMQPALH